MVALKIRYNMTRQTQKCSHLKKVAGKKKKAPPKPTRHNARGQRLGGSLENKTNNNSSHECKRGINIDPKGVRAETPKEKWHLARRSAKNTS
jgi:hypothetical protein